MEINMQKISEGYDKIADDLGLYPEFYEFIVAEFSKYHVNKDACILDIGCGNGKLLEAIFNFGYHNLSGVDLSERNIFLAQKKVPAANLEKLDVQQNDIVGTFDIIFMTEVIEHLILPLVSLKKVKNALKPQGLLFLTFPNKLAFFPFYYLKPFILGLNWWPGLQKRMRWFCLPYEMRSKQPIDHSYSPKDVDAFLNNAGLRVEYVNGMRLWPMLRVPNWHWTTPLIDAFEKFLRPVTPKNLYYRYLYVCSKHNV